MIVTITITGDDGTVLWEWRGPAVGGSEPNEGVSPLRSVAQHFTAREMMERVRFRSAAREAYAADD